MFINYESKSKSESSITEIRERSRLEIKDLVNQARDGSSDAADKLLTRLQPLIYSTIKRHAVGSDWEDLLQEAAFAILDGIRDYDETKGIPFLAYIKIKLNFHIYNICRRERKREYYNNTNSISNSNSNSNLNNNEETDPLDRLADEREDTLGFILKKEKTAALKEALKILDPKHRQVIILYYYNRISLKDIAVKLNVSYKTVQRYKAKAENQLAISLLAYEN